MADVGALMNHRWTDEQVALKQSVVAFAQREMTIEAETGFSRERWRKCAVFGLLGLPMPEAFGGSGCDLVTTMLMMEGLGYGCRDNGLLFALNAQMWSVQHPILVFGTEAQRERYLPALCSGDMIGAHGMTEAGSGSDAFALRTRAERVDDGYILRGAKLFVTNAPVADIAVVFATLDPSSGIAGITAFIVDLRAPGVTVGRPMEKMGLKSAPMAEVALTDCHVLTEQRLGAEGAGSTIFNSSMEWERSCILASHVGAMEHQLETCVSYARERRQFGRPIGEFQSVSNRIADMKVRLETSRLLIRQVALLKQAGRPAAMEAAIAKLYTSECFVQSSLDAIRIHGASGYTTELGIERDLRDAIGGTIYSGTSDIQRVIIARWLGL